MEKQNWLQPLEFLDGLALCQMLPGATVVQMAAYVGYRLRRTPGALSAAAGFVLPAFVLMTGLSYLYFHYGALPWVKPFPGASMPWLSPCCSRPCGGLAGPWAGAGRVGWLPA